MILVVGGIKGGTGKTTLATNLAVLAKSEGKSVILVDADEQSSATDWAHQRSHWKEKVVNLVDVPTIPLQGKNLGKHLEYFRQDYDHVIVDTGGRDTISQRAALMEAHIYLIPFQPRSLDIWTAERVQKLCRDARFLNPNIRTLCCLNRADSRGSDNATTLRILGLLGEIDVLFSVVVNRKAFSNASAQGMGVIELPGELAAKEEVNNLYRAIYRNHIVPIS